MKDPAMVAVYIGIAVVVIGLAIIYRRNIFAWFRPGERAKETAPPEPPRPLCPICIKAVEAQKTTNLTDLKERAIAKRDHGIEVYDWKKLKQVTVERKQAKTLWMFLMADTFVHKVTISDSDLDVCGMCAKRSQGEAEVMVKSLQADEARTRQKEIEAIVGFNSAQLKTLREREKQESK